MAADLTAGTTLVPAPLASPSRAIAAGVAVLAIVVHREWWSLVFVAFAVATALLEPPEARRRGVVGLALAMGGSAGLVFVGLFTQSVGAIGDGYGCRPDPCPSLGPWLQLGGTAVSITGVLGLLGAGWFLRRPGRGELALPALNLVLFGLFKAAVVFGAAWGNALVEIAAVTAATALLALAVAGPRLLRAAVFAQVVDLGTFGAVWQLGEGELNPLGRVLMGGLFGPAAANESWPWEAAAVSGMLLILAKMGLIGFLVRVTPHLGRYRNPVLFAAAVVGSIGAAANLAVIL